MILNEHLFLDASLHLYNRVCLSVSRNFMVEKTTTTDNCYYRQTTESCYPIVPGGKSAREKKMRLMMLKISFI